MPLAVIFKTIPAHDIPFAAQAAIFAEAFSGYIGGSFVMRCSGARSLHSCPGHRSLLQPVRAERGGTVWLWLYHAKQRHFAARGQGRPGRDAPKRRATARLRESAIPPSQGQFAFTLFLRAKLFPLVLQRHFDREFSGRSFFSESLGPEIFEPL